MADPPVSLFGDVGLDVTAQVVPDLGARVAFKIPTSQYIEDLRLQDGQGGEGGKGPGREPVCRPLYEASPAQGPQKNAWVRIRSLRQRRVPGAA